MIRFHSTIKFISSIILYIFHFTPNGPTALFSLLTTYLDFINIFQAMILSPLSYNFIFPFIPWSMYIFNFSLIQPIMIIFKIPFFLFKYCPLAPIKIAYPSINLIRINLTCFTLIRYLSTTKIFINLWPTTTISNFLNLSLIIKN